MDLSDIMKDVKNLNEYISATQNIVTKCNNIKVPTKITTVLTNKNICSLEVEYFIKSEENGAACILFERMLAQPPSKKWAILAKELINTLQYWLDAIRKHLITRNAHWWMFLKKILKFILEMRVKDPTIPNMLVEFTVECLLDLATAAKPEASQRHEILHCLNIISADSQREVRFAMRTKFGDYFVKLAERMVTTGYLPCQHSILECLLRWLVPRHDRSLRSAAADKWLPASLCPPSVKDLFLSKNWLDFYKDSRAFLNALNEANGLVTSVVCRSLSMGGSDLVKGSEKVDVWLDFNSLCRCLSVLLHPQLLTAFGVSFSSCEILVIDYDITDTATLCKQPLGLTISISTLRAPYIRPSEVDVGDIRDVTIVVSSRTELRALDLAMRDTFADKYILRMDLDTDVSQSPQISHNTSKGFVPNLDEDTRFSHPAIADRRRRPDIKCSRNADRLKSPSSVSTSSLAQLRVKLEALPRFEGHKKPKPVCSPPQLSNVTELDERSLATTVKFAHYGVRSFKSISRSDNESVTPKTDKKTTLSDGDTKQKSASHWLTKLRNLPGFVVEETTERLPELNHHHDLVEELLQEALGSKSRTPEYKVEPLGAVSDSGINTDEKKTQEISEAVDNTPNEPVVKKKVPVKKKITVVSKSTTDDESNTEPWVGTTRHTKKHNLSLNVNINESKRVVDAKIVDEFFAQHVPENPTEVINPSLAGNINATSSESSEDFDDIILIANEDVNTDIEDSIFNKIEVIDCVNNMVDKVCSDFDKYLYNDKVTERKAKKLDVTGKDQKILELKSTENPPQSKSTTVTRSKRNIKMQVKSTAKKVKIREPKKDTNMAQKNNLKMSTINEQVEEEIVSQKLEQNKAAAVENQQPTNETPPKDDTSLIRRKRKLYSPKDESIQAKHDEITIEQVNDDVPLSKIKAARNIRTPTIATCYKEIEKERNKKTRIRIQKSKGRKEEVIELPSPRTMRNNSVFDHLKQTVESNENITLVGKCADVFNFTSGSEDEDFKKKVEVKTRATTVGSGIKKRVLRSKNTDSSTTDDKPVKRRKYTKRTNKSKLDVKIDPVIDLVDERMREASREQLNTSNVIESAVSKEPIKIKPVLHQPLRMEFIEDEPCLEIAPKKKVTKRNKKTEILAVKKEKGLSKKDKELEIKDRLAVVSEKDDDGTISPLPGLVVESMPKPKNDVNDSLTANMLENFKNYLNVQDIRNDSVNTQNMLSDVERLNCSIQNDLDDACFVDDGNKENSETVTKKDTLKNIVKKQIKVAQKDKIDRKIIKEATIVLEKMPIDGSESEKSIPTDGITAHVDSDEAPPTAESIAEHISPREIQDMDNSMKEYFLKLTREMNISKSTSEKTEPVMQQNKARHSVISPVVSADKMTFDDISKWIPSRRTSNSNNSQSNETLVTTPKNLTSQQSSTPNLETKKNKSPVVSLTRMYLEDINEWLPMPNDFENMTLPEKKNSGNIKLVYSLRSNLKGKNKKSHDITHKGKPVKDDVKPKIFLTDSDTDLDKQKNITRNLRRNPVRQFIQQIKSPEVCHYSDSGEDDYAKDKSTKKRYVKLAAKSKNESVEKSNVAKTVIKERKAESGESNTKNVKTVRSIISPINLDFKPNIVDLKSDDDDKCVRRIRSILSKPEDALKSAISANKSTVSTTRDSSVRPAKLPVCPSRSPVRQRISNVDLSRSPVRGRKSYIDLSRSPVRQRISNVDLSRSPVRGRKSYIDLSRSPVRQSKSPVHLSGSPCRTKLPVRPSRSPLRTSSRRKSLGGPQFRSSCLVCPESPVSPRSPVRPRSSVRSRSPVCVLKPSSDSPILSVSKKRMYDPNKKVDILESVTVQSGSSVNEWINRSVPKDKDTQSQLAELIKNVIEKLDTTLVESNQNTCKSLVESSIETQKRLDNYLKKVRAMSKQNKERLEEFYIETKNRLDKDLERTETLILELMEKQKNDARQIIRNESQQRICMVTLIKEDFQVVLDQINRSRNTYSP